MSGIKRLLKCLSYPGLHDVLDVMTSMLLHWIIHNFTIISGTCFVVIFTKWFLVLLIVLLLAKEEMKCWSMAGAKGISFLTVPVMVG